MTTSPSTDCLNCSTPLMGPYCSICGQAASTHKMSFRHFLAHDLVHGIFHLDKGIIFTLKQILTRPGKAAREYLAGKRVGYFNLLTLLLLCAALFLYSQEKVDLEELGTDRAGYLIRLLIHYAKWVIICSGFIFSFSTYLLFRKARLNYTEHLILNGFLLAGILFINGLESILLRFWDADTSIISIIVTITYVSWGYWGAFRQDYAFKGWLLRAILHFLFSIVLLVGIGIGALTIYAILINPKH